ncbi:pirin family protein [Nocardioides mangrovicus]|uniref:Pirin family protein n=2 Tax=Nocardioides mangrovicus TaxID=2478913 RepID=A0A3L8P790_9ACTN|nr:pirin family protein [Nocardioides mangrovicus]
MTVRRTLPSRGRTTIGAWCFADHYGPDAVAETGGMVVPPHPHTGLQTVSWLFTGEIEHRDSAGHRAVVRPGEMNLMTAGRGISHSEISTDGTEVLHGVQLWLALPDASREIEPGFEHYVPPVVDGHGWWARVFLGAVLGGRSPVTTYSGLLGAELTLAAGVRLTVPVDPAYEHGVLVDTGNVVLDGEPVAGSRLGYVPPGHNTLQLQALEPTRLVLLGGVPLGERLVMWWNFVGRSHEEIAEYRRAWQALLDDGEPGRFALPDDDRHPSIPAPEMPRGVRLTPRT